MDLKSKKDKIEDNQKFESNNKKMLRKQSRLLNMS